MKVETNGCFASDFDQYGDMEAFGVHPDWQRQLTKFASVQDRLSEWKPEVMDKIKVFSCIAIKALDFDAIRIDKATQVTVDALAQWTSNTRACAAKLGKNNFFITGEVTGGDTFGSLYLCVRLYIYSTHRTHYSALKRPRSYTNTTPSRFLVCGQYHEHSKSIFSSRFTFKFSRRCGVPLLDLSCNFTFLGNGWQSSSRL